MQAVFFDLDETLLDRTSALQEFVFWQAEKMLTDCIVDSHKFVKRFIELDACGKVWKDVVYTTLVDEFGIENRTVEELLASYELCFCRFCKLMPNAKEALLALHESGYKLGLISNGKSPFQERNFNALGIDHLFSTAIVSDAVGLRKPDKRIFELACNEIECSLQESIFVGDNIKADIGGANGAGMYTIYFTKNTNNGGADAAFSNYDQLVDLVRNSS